MRKEDKARLLNRIIRKKGKKVYYFDSNGVYQCIPESEIINYNISKYEYRMDGSICYFLLQHWAIGLDNGIKFKKVIARMQVGETVEDFVKYYEETELEKHEKPSGLNRFVTSIGKPLFVRSNDNPNTDTFDFIYVDVFLVSQWDKDKKEYIQDNIKEIKAMVIEKLEKDTDFQKTGVTINFLKLSRLTLKTGEKELQFVFELKSI